MAAGDAGRGEARAPGARPGGARLGGVRLGVELQVDENTPVFVISVAAQLAGMHPQTLRQYDRLGLVSPGRTAGRGRRYSARDVAVLREVQRLSQEEGVNLAGIKRILELELENDRLREHVHGLTDELEDARARLSAGRRIFAADPDGAIVAVRPGRRPERMPPSGALVVWRPTRHPLSCPVAVIMPSPCMVAAGVHDHGGGWVVTCGPSGPGGPAWWPRT
jgi:MerR family transcriptional regulator/heat shock protein HspR